jgi:hypothetical protein
MRKLLALGLLLGCTPAEPPTNPRRDAPVVADPSPAPPADPQPEELAPASCLAEFSFDSHASVLSEQRGRAGAKRWDDFARSYPASSIIPEEFHPVELVASVRIGDTPLLWFTPDYAQAVVNSAVFGELKVVDATGLAVDRRVEIGALTELGLGGLRGPAWGEAAPDRPARLSGRELLEFLMKAGVIQTFVHIGSTVCLLSEVDDDRGYRARLAGEHEYYTSQENRDAFAFEFELTAAGGIAITGAQPPASE